MKFLLDQNISPKVTEALRHSGHDAIDTRDVKMQTASDDKLWEFAQQETRFFITFDLDFANIKKYPPGPETGTIVFRTRSTSSKTVLGLLNTLFKTYTEAQLAGKLIIITETQFRIRK